MFRSDQGADNKERQMTISEYEKIGECICKVTMTFLPFPNCKARLQSVTQKIASLLSEHYIKSLGLHCTNEGKEENNHPLKPVIYIEKTNDIANLSVLEEVQEDDLQGKNNIEGPKTFRHKYERNKFKHIENNLKIEENLLPNANLKLTNAAWLSAHRTPVETAEYVSQAEGRGIEVVIAAAGGAAHLAGVCAAHTLLPVLGVPMESASLKGLDSLLSTVQMPAGIPVGTLAIGGRARATRPCWR